MAEPAAAVRRVGGVVWRCGPDRVLTLRVANRSDTAANELFGAAALVWLALDEPATPDELARRLAEAGFHADPTDGLAALRERALVEDAP
jgi:hypothetical protein